jgi:hypothetical protein
MPHLLELLFRKLRLERLHQARSGFSGRIRDDMQLNRHVFRLIDS